MSEWMPIVYGRTYEVDFRLIAVPRGFASQDRDWVKPYLQGTFESGMSEHTGESMRWCVIRNNHFCVIGVNCRVSQLAADMQRDKSGRPLSVFLGYLSKNPNSALPPMTLEHFSDLFEIVRLHWFDQAWQADKVDERDELYSLPELPLIEVAQEVKFNTRLEGVRLWQATEANNEVLWTAASNSLVHSSLPLSLCLGLSRRRSAQEGPFLNASASDVVSPTEAPRIFLPVYGQPPPPSWKQQTAAQHPSSPRSIGKRERAAPFQPLVGGLRRVLAAVGEGFGDLLKMGETIPERAAEEYKDHPRTQHVAQTYSHPPAGFRYTKDEGESGESSGSEETQVSPYTHQRGEQEIVQPKRHTTAREKQQRGKEGSPPPGFRYVSPAPSEEPEQAVSSSPPQPASIEDPYRDLVASVNNLVLSSSTRLQEEQEAQPNSSAEPAPPSGDIQSPQTTASSFQQEPEPATPDAGEASVPQTEGRDRQE